MATFFLGFIAGLLCLITWDDISIWWAWNSPSARRDLRERRAKTTPHDSTLVEAQ